MPTPCAAAAVALPATGLAGDDAPAAVAAGALVAGAAVPAVVAAAAVVAGAVVPGADVDVVEPLQPATSMQSRAVGTIAAGIVFM
ncbi:MAG TPA: hypothetical protein VFG00_11520 [Acidothermaceae bacterium]|nr:hypothetical protein [Acidothermaceae bacterium]